MNAATLTRFDSNKDGTFGRMGPWVSLEEEDLDNASNVSCIPLGSYLCRRRMYNRGGYETFEVTGVEGRSHILFHPANTEEDIAGCIGLGLSLGVLEVTAEEDGKLTHKVAVLSSRTAFDQFMAEREGVDEFILNVVAA